MKTTEHLTADVEAARAASSAALVAMAATRAAFADACTGSDVGAIEVARGRLYLAAHRYADQLETEAAAVNAWRKRLACEAADLLAR